MNSDLLPRVEPTVASVGNKGSTWKTYFTGVKLKTFTSLDDSKGYVVSLEVAKQMDGGNCSGLCQ